MVHHYISCYFYNLEENTIRKKLKDEFSARYPFVTILECNGSPGFIDYQMINKFLSKINKETLKSVTLIDADLILPDDFRTLIEKSIADDSDVIHGCKKLHEYRNNKVIYTLDSMSKYFDGFSGAIWSFSKRFLESINYTFCDQFTYGGADYLFAKLFIQGRPEQYFKDQLLSAYEKIFKKFYEQAKNFRGITLNCEVKHLYHGNRNSRIIPLHLYSGLTDEKLKIILSRRN